jgi:Fic family protein
MDISKNILQKLQFSEANALKIMQKLSLIDNFKGSFVAVELQHSKHLKELKKIATVESIGSSTRIEGATLNDDEVDKLLKSIKVTRLKTRDQQEVIGYYETLSVILENYKDITLSERYIHQLHGILLKFSHKDQNHKGKYKSISNKVVANYPDGSKRTIFKTTEPALTPTEMQATIKWTNERLSVKDMHPLLIIATFIYEFLSIHPYQDGNGRLSRLLTSLLMMQQQYHFIQYISFENVIEKKKEAYYKALMEGQKNRGKSNERMEQWLVLSAIHEIEQGNKCKTSEYFKIHQAKKEITNSRCRKIFFIGIPQYTEKRPCLFSE